MSIFKGQIGDFFYVKDIHPDNCRQVIRELREGLIILWFTAKENSIKIDGVDKNFTKNEVVFLTDFHQIEDVVISGAKIIQFNRSFFCILENDEKVGCKGVLFFGSDELPVIEIKEEVLQQLQFIYNRIETKIEKKDDLQLGMLQTLLTELLIYYTREYRKQKDLVVDEENNIIRDFNFLVEQHFRSKTKVSDYANMLHKAPKTLKNIFSRHNYPSPSNIIQKRRALEAKRQLQYTDKTIKEISFELNFSAPQSFSRFFKKHTQRSPQEFRLSKSA